MAKMYFIPERDRADAKAQLEEWRAQRTGGPDYQLTNTDPGGLVLVLTRPKDFSAGLCMRLDYDIARPFVWLVDLMGYPAFSGRSFFRVEWTSSLGTITSERIPYYATADQFFSLQPEMIRAIASIDGGTMLIDDGDGGSQLVQTGRWFVAFAEEPIWTPKIIELTDQRLQGRCLIHWATMTGAVAEYRMIGSISGPQPVHPGALAYMQASGSAMVLIAIEPRVYQEYFRASVAGFTWSVGPYTVAKFEGESFEVTIDVVSDGVSGRSAPVELTIDVSVEFGPTVSSADVIGDLDSWLSAAVAGRAGWSYASGRLFLTMPADHESDGIQFSIPTVLDSTIEGEQLVRVRLQNATASDGVALIDQAVATLSIVERDSAIFRIFGPSIAQAGTDAAFSLAIDGVFLAGTILSVTLSTTGTATPGDVSDWAEDLRLYANTVAGLVFDAGSGVLELTVQADGGVAAIPISVGILQTAAGKTFGIELSGASASVGVAVIGKDQQILDVADLAPMTAAVAGPASTRPGVVTFGIVISGTVLEGTEIELQVELFGSIDDSQVNDWEAVLSDWCAAKPGFEFSAGFLNITAQNDGSIEPIPVVMDVLPGALGRTVGVEISRFNVSNRIANITAAIVEANIV